MSVTPNAIIHLFRYDNKKKDLILSDSCREDKVCTVDDKFGRPSKRRSMFHTIREFLADCLLKQ